MTRQINMLISETPILTDQALKHFTEANPEAGAIISFSGHVRADKDNGGTQALFLQAYEPMTQNMIEKKRQDALRQWGLNDALILHRTGHMTPGDAIVFVATAAAHRRDAFEAADYLMDYLKTEAFFWKKEIGKTGAKWVEPKETDYQDAKRWADISDNSALLDKDK